MRSHAWQPLSPEACDGLLLVAFDDGGNVIAECAPGEPVVTAA